MKNNKLHPFALTFSIGLALIIPSFAFAKENNGVITAIADLQNQINAINLVLNDGGTEKNSIPAYPDDWSTKESLFLTNIYNYIVPAGKNLYITTIWSPPSGSLSFDIEGISWSGFTLSNHAFHFIIGEGMTLTTQDPINIIGFLVDKKTDILIHDLSIADYVVPDNKTLVINSHMFPWPPNVFVDGAPFYSIAFAHSGQTVSGTGIFIGFLE